LIWSGTPKAKAVCWGDPDTETRKRGEQKGLTFAENVLVVFKVPDLKISSEILDPRFSAILSASGGTMPKLPAKRTLKTTKDVKIFSAHST